ncbi:MAG: heme biosynthesis HemY N-terminal domain-containing protein [Halofilum sp. (in: g-proteobacteria)]|nr:heme biosynthesis HemY N-terminal domain-containing protein [Halofilum sp. (in: g-proteobacteria)]
MRWVLMALLVLAVAVGAAALLQRDPGYLYVDLGQWTLETTVAFALAALVVLFALLYVAMRVLGGLMRGPRALRSGAHVRRTEKSRRGLTRGLIEMAEGRWEQAERLLTRHAEDSDTSLLNYLAAARAAQQAGAYENRDRYLKAAIEANPEADVAVSLTQAELQLAHHQTEHALATLTRLRGLAPNHTYVMKLLARLYAELEDWDRLAELMPELRRRKVFAVERLDALERAAELGRIGAVDGDAAALARIWDGLSRRMRADAEVMHAYARQLVAAGDHATAEKRVRQFLGKRWSEDLAHDYGLVQAEDAASQLNQAESWLHERGRSPVLLLTLGRLCVRNRLWGKARIYFESSLEIEPMAETYCELAALLDQLGEIGAAREQYRLGLELAVAESSAPRAERAARQQAHTAIDRAPAPKPVEAGSG